MFGRTHQAHQRLIRIQLLHVADGQVGRFGGMHARVAMLISCGPGILWLYYSEEPFKDSMEVEVHLRSKALHVLLAFEGIKLPVGSHVLAAPTENLQAMFAGQPFLSADDCGMWGLLWHDCCLVAVVAPQPVMLVAQQLHWCLLVSQGVMSRQMSDRRYHNANNDGWHACLMAQGGISAPFWVKTLGKLPLSPYLPCSTLHLCSRVNCPAAVTASSRAATSMLAT